MSIRILLVDDHQMTRDGVRSILELEDGLDVVGEAENGKEAREMARTLRPDVILMDIGMKDLNGIDATRQIKDQNPEAKVVALSTYSEEAYVLSMFEAGASAYVLKEAAVQEMPRAIRAVAKGHHYTSPEVWRSAGL
jgi:NarL family two-component system response regulator LiaR